MRQHRMDIDGLRALAVLPITLFHAGIPGFHGGYVGVDVFFVISGYLITSIIARDYSAGQFSYVQFYERRIRRIFPALIGMLLASLVAAYFILLPGEMNDFSKSVIGTIFFASNIVFYKQSGYFEGAAEDKPLLHTWSLGIEEQFYIIFPIVFFITLRYFYKHSKFIIILGAVISLSICIYFTPSKPSAAFYLIPARAWELLAGSLIAIGAMPKVRSAPARNGLAAIGVTLILAAVLLLSRQTPFPGTAALLPVIGTALVINYGQDTATARFLSLRPFVFIGLISYSLYLWHWPLIVFGRNLGLIDGKMGPAIAVVLVSIATGYLSYRFIETPFRAKARFSQRRIFVLAAVGGAAVLVGGTGYLRSDGLRDRYPPAVLAFDDGQRDVSPMRNACHPSFGLADPASACVFGGGKAESALWGDSHGVELAYALGSIANPLRSATYSACPPALGFAVAERPDCDQHNHLVAKYLRETPQIRTVYVKAFYSAYIDSPDFQRGLTAAVHSLLEAGKSVVMVGPIPAESDRNLPMRLARQGEFRVPMRDYLTRQRDVIALLTALEMRGARVIWPSDYFCSKESCAVVVGGAPVLFDNHHLSMTGARYLAGQITPLVWGEGVRPVAITGLGQPQISR